MARINTVANYRGPKKEGKSLHRCASCGQTIEVGTAYKWFQSRIGYSKLRKNYHISCSIPRSHQTSSRMGEIYDAQDALDLGACTSVDDLRSVLDDFASVVRDVGSGYEESADNMEEGFGHSTYTSDEIREKAEALESWADEIESASADLEDPEEPETEEECTECSGTGEVDNEDVDENDEDATAECPECHGTGKVESPFGAPEAQVEEHLEEQRQKAQDAIDNCPL